MRAILGKPVTHGESVDILVLWRTARWMLFGIGAVYCVAALFELTYFPDPLANIVPVDGYVYWLGDLGSEHYRYSPAFYWLTAPLRLMPFEAFMAVWTGLHLAAIAWLAPWAILFAFDDVIRGNVNTFLAVAVVLSIGGRSSRGAVGWAVPLLTKVTPGVGVLVHIGRREWGRLAIAAGSTLAVVAVGSLLAPDLWGQWFDSLRAGPDTYANIWTGSLIPRIVIGAGLCLAASRWLWLLPVGMLVAMPGLWPSSFALLAAVPRLIRGTSTRRC